MFVFDKRINPNKPLCSDDLPPEGWDSGIDTSDYHSSLFGYPSELFTSCFKWEQRELARHKKSHSEDSLDLAIQTATKAHANQKRKNGELISFIL